MKRMWMVLVACVVWAVGASAEVQVEIHHEPLVQKFLEKRGDPPPTGGEFDASTKSYVPDDIFWYIPHFQADMMEPGDTTYVSIRNDELRPITVTVQYFDVLFDLQTEQVLELMPHELVAIALRDVPGLPVGRDGYARGIVRVVPDGLAYVDAFHLETRNGFAVGGEAFTGDEMCEHWNARFLRFSGAGGTNLVFFVYGPKGADPSDPATVLGDVYAENGEFINSIEIRTDEYSFEIPVHDYVLGGVEFGTVELVINSFFWPHGFVEIRHRALGEYSLGHLATCAD